MEKISNANITMNLTKAQLINLLKKMPKDDLAKMVAQKNAPQNKPKPPKNVPKPANKIKREPVTKEDWKILSKMERTLKKREEEAKHLPFGHYRANDDYLAMMKTYKKNAEIFAPSYSVYQYSDPLGLYETHMREIYKKQKHAYKVNLFLGYKLRNKNTDEVREYYPSINTAVWTKPRVVKNKTQLNALLDKMSQTVNFEKSDFVQRPNTEWQFDTYTTYHIKTYPMDFSIGCAVPLPLSIAKNRFINALDKFNDHLCFWRCLAIHNGALPKRSTNKAKELYEEYYKTPYTDSYEGVNTNELDSIETHFNIPIVIFTLSDTERAKLFRRSNNTNEEKTMNLNLFEQHFSYIINLEKFCRNFSCGKCEKLFETAKQLHRHEKTCTATVVKKFRGGRFERKKTIFEKLQLTPKNRFCDYFIVYDCEANLEKQQPSEDTNLKYTTKHTLLSVSVNSNVPKYDKPKCFINDGDTGKLIRQWIEYMLEISNEAYELLHAKFEKEIDSLDEKETKQFEDFIKCVPVVGFNSSFYDINLNKKLFFACLKEFDQECKIVIKKANRYMCIRTPNLNIVDILNYLAPCSLRKFLRAYDCKMEKGYFPYEYIQSIENLKENKLAPIEAFYSSLHKVNVLEEEYLEFQKRLVHEKEQDILKDMGLSTKPKTKEEVYEQLLNIWKTEGMKTMKDFLIWYNNIDVNPFVEAIQKMVKFYNTCDIDLFQDGVSVPSLVETYLHRETKKLFPKVSFSLIKQEDADLYDMFKRNMVGGPSLIFHRYHEKGCTHIRGGKECQRIIGEDANALYLWSLGQEMPTGQYERMYVKNDTKDLQQFLKLIRQKEIFGFVECDIEVPKEKYEYFSEMQPIFKNSEIDYDNIGQHMQNYLTDHNEKYGKGKKLIGSFFGKKINLLTPLLNFYLEIGLVVTRIYQIVKYKPVRCFKWFMETVSNYRREGDLDSSKAIMGETFKLWGNSAYGKTVMDKEKHTNVRYRKQNQMSQEINDPMFKDCNKLDLDTYEVVKGKKMVTLDQPLQIGHAVYQYAKLRMLQFYYNCIDKYIDRSDFQYCEMDTDSAYMALSSDSLDKVIKPNMINEWKADKYNWFPHPCCEKKCNKCQQCKTALFEKRTAGLFKEEFVGDGIIALCSKMYYCWSGDKNKYSSKGIQKSNNLTKKMFMDVLANGTPSFVVNTGFRAKDGEVFTYTQLKKGLSYTYVKRRVLWDGVSTTYTLA